MLDPKQLDALLHPQFDAEALKAAKPVGYRSGRFPRRCLRQDRLHR